MEEKDRNEKWQGEERRSPSQGDYKGDDRRKGGDTPAQQAGPEDGLEEG